MIKYTNHGTTSRTSAVIDSDRTFEERKWTESDLFSDTRVAGPLVWETAFAIGEYYQNNAYHFNAD